MIIMTTIVLNILDQQHACNTVESCDRVCWKVFLITSKIKLLHCYWISVWEFKIFTLPNTYDTILAIYLLCLAQMRKGVSLKNGILTRNVAALLPK
jgi:hypothetical protein